MLVQVFISVGSADLTSFGGARGAFLAAESWREFYLREKARAFVNDQDMNR
jgi:hypothetical protein